MVRSSSAGQGRGGRLGGVARGVEVAEDAGDRPLAVGRGPGSRRPAAGRRRGGRPAAPAGRGSKPRAASTDGAWSRTSAARSRTRTTARPSTAIARRSSIRSRSVARSRRPSSSSRASQSRRKPWKSAGRWLISKLLNSSRPGWSGWRRRARPASLRRWVRADLPTRPSTRQGPPDRRGEARLSKRQRRGIRVDLRVEVVRVEPPASRPGSETLTSGPQVSIASRAHRQRSKVRRPRGPSKRSSVGWCESATARRPIPSSDRWSRPTSSVSRATASSGDPQTGVRTSTPFGSRVGDGSVGSGTW